MEYWTSNEYLLHRCKIILHRKKACFEVVVGNSVRHLIDLLIVGMLNPMDRGKRVYHMSLRASYRRRGYCIQIVHGRDEGDHHMGFHMYYVGHCIPYLLRSRCSMAVVDLGSGR